MIKQSFTLSVTMLILSFLCPAFLNAQIVTDERMFSFEEPQLPACITGVQSQLGISGAHYKDGKHSLEWTFEPNGRLELRKDLKFEKKDPTGKDLYLSAFIVWIYNEQPQDAAIEFEFLKDGRKCASFPFGINFKGWRAAWVCYERDMQGTPEEGMNELRIVAPDAKGRLFIDHLITATKVDARQQTADLQVPFVNAGTTNHWLVLYKHSLLKPDIELTPVSDKQRQEMKLLEKRFRDMIYTKGKVTEKEAETIRKKYDLYQITYKDGQVSGVPVFMVRASEAYERMIPDWDKDMLTKMGIEMRAYFDLMKRIAVAYNNSEAGSPIRKEMRRKFLAMYDHITDQGVAYGSCWGNIHHYGYSVRGLYPAYFLMKDVLREEGKLLEAERTLRWYAITNEVYPKPEGNGIDMDSFNTQTTGRIASILMMEDTPEKLQYLKSFSRWIDYGCRPAPGLAGSFKVDGGGMIVCLGSDIENTNTDYPTETTIFQLAVTDKEAHDYWKNNAGEGKVWMDHLGTGYYVPVAARFEKNFPQYSRMQDTGKETKGDWVSLIIDHGKAPKAGSYEYAILPGTDRKTMTAFAKKPAYSVLQQDRNAHILESPSDKITSYVLFETPQSLLPGGLLQRTDTSCLVMVRKESADKVLLTVAQPDLALYRGPSDEAFDKDGKRMERSIYSRPWIDNESGEIPVTVTLKGRWKVVETPYCKVVSEDKKQTVLRFLCKDGASYEVELEK